MRRRAYIEPIEEEKKEPVNIEKYKKNGKWNIVGALDCILQFAHNSELNDDFWKNASSPLTYLHKRLKMEDIQIIALAILIESGDSESWRSLGKYLNISRLRMMTYSEEVEQLVTMGWIHRSSRHDNYGESQAFRLNFGVVTALRKNKVFVPEKLDGLTNQQFMDKLERFMSRNTNTNSYFNHDLLEWVDNLISKNPELEVSKMLKKISNRKWRFIMILILVDYAEYAGTEAEGLWLSTIEHILDDEFDHYELYDELREGSSPLFKKKLIEFECNDGVINNERYLLTREVKNKILKDYKPRVSRAHREIKSHDPYLTKHSDIKVKDLYYNYKENKQIEQLNSLLMETNFKDVQKRLEEEGMRKGFSCIFYGSPGTGKTETVLQLARKTERDVMFVDIASLRDKWVGESEKNIKAVFEKYRNLCDGPHKKPILLFNEADAIFGIRMEKAERSVDKMNNAMQNIILQEIETLDGILIATTNLTGALDKAFERRFLYKIEFNKPETAVKEKIWYSMFKDKLSPEEVRRLAKDFDFSGGEIENISRKSTVDYILEGTDKNHLFEKVYQFCKEERLNQKSGKSIGFK